MDQRVLLLHRLSMWLVGLSTQQMLIKNDPATEMTQFDTKIRFALCHSDSYDRKS